MSVQKELNQQLEIPTLTKGQVYYTASGLGGKFALKFIEQTTDGIYHFQNISPDFNTWTHKVKPSEINDFLL